MKCGSVLLILAVFAPACSAAQTNPLAKVMEMVDELTAKINKEGVAETKAYGEFFEWCDDTAKNTQNDIKTSTSKKAALVAAIDKLTSDIEDSETKIDELVAALAKDSKELKAATAVREKEQADFKAEEAELVAGIDTIDRAVGIVEKAMAKSNGAFAQVDTKNLNSLLKALGTMMDAAAVGSYSKQKLLAMVQQSQSSDADDQDTGAPAGSTYSSQSGGIVDVLNDMRDKADEELQGLRGEETTAKNNFAMLKQSLEDSMAADNKDLADEKDARSAAEEEKATATGDLEIATKALNAGAAESETNNNVCMQTATDHANSKKSRAEELKVIAEAKKILAEATGGAVDQTYSLLQVRAHTQIDIAKTEALAMIKQLAKTNHSPALAQLASRIAATVKFGAASGEDPFGKIKGLITDMVAKLEKEANEDATEKAYCDEQMSKTGAKKADLDDTVEKLSSKVDKAAAKSTELKEDVKTLQAELAKLASEQKEMDSIRKETHANYLVASKDLAAGLAGVRKALEMLRKYYGGSAAAAMVQMDTMMEQPKMPESHSAAGGAGSGIIGMLEVCESDFAKGLAETEKEEADAAEEYESTSQENEVATTTKTQDVKYKTQEFTGLDKSIADLSADRDTVEEELGAVNSYFDKIKDRCIAKPESYADIKKRRDAEIQGLKEAASILEGSAFAQTKSKGRHGHHFLGM